MNLVRPIASGVFRYVRVERSTKKAKNFDQNEQITKSLFFKNEINPLKDLSLGREKTALKKALPFTKRTKVIERGDSIIKYPPIDSIE